MDEPNTSKSQQKKKRNHLRFAKTYRTVGVTLSLVAVTTLLGGLMLGAQSGMLSHSNETIDRHQEKEDTQPTTEPPSEKTTKPEEPGSTPVQEEPKKTIQLEQKSLSDKQTRGASSRSRNTSTSCSPERKKILYEAYQQAKKIELKRHQQVIGAISKTKNLLQNLTSFIFTTQKEKENNLHERTMKQITEDYYKKLRALGCNVQ